MAQVAFSVRMDSDLKKEFEEQCGNFGMSMATAINVFARTVVREKRIPFEVSSKPVLDNATMMVADKRAVYNAGVSNASRMLKIMQALSLEAEKAGVSDMSLDEINAEIDAARNGR